MACYFLPNVMIIMSFSSSLLLPVCTIQDSIRAGESINNANQTLTSAGGNFALGFFSPGNSTNRYIGIWYKTISKQTVIWVANRETPVAKNSPAVFRLSDDGNLVLFDGRRQVVWSTNATIPDLAINSTVAQLSDNGNLVLRLGNNTVLWQSFDNPTADNSWEQSDNSWVVAWKMPVVEPKCDFYGQCAPFSSCEPNGSHPFCSCSKGFEPKDQKAFNLGNWKGGCARTRAPKCDMGDWFSKFEGTKLPDYSISLGNMTVCQCESKCRDNCSCTAYAYANLTGETTVNCMNWFGDLVDLKHNDCHGKDLYVRFHGSDQVGDDGKLNHKSRSLIAIAAIAISAGFLLICGFGFILRGRGLRSQETTDRGVHEIDTNSSAYIAGQSNGELLSFSLRSILAATDNFSVVKQLGEGGYGPVYKGNLPEVQEVAIKKLSKKSLQGTEEFMNELKLIAKLQHKNLVRLLGCCVEQEEKILIYEYMCNGSLDKFLFYPSKQTNLDWTKRFQITEGIAQGLIYLHKYSRLKVIHRDLKASNILLDEAMNPKISDFGTARSFGINQTEANTRRVVGAYGYMSPEYALYGKFSEKSDIFSFGVLMLEIVSGRRNTSFHITEHSLTLLGWAWENWKEGSCLEFIDPSIGETCNFREALKSIAVGLLCVQEFPGDRPTMYDVVLMLSNKNASIPSPKEPAFSSCRSSNTVNYYSQISSSYSNNEVTITMPEAR